MTLLQSILLGALQGITEFLPVSSSGHLVIMKNILNLEEVPVLFDVFLHAATLIVVCLVFRKRIGGLFKALFHFLQGKKGEEDKESLRLILIILLATVITAVIGFAVSSLGVEQYPRIVSGLFLVTGVILLWARNAKGKNGNRELKIRHALITGAAQGFGVFPGISRSGITISAAVLSGLSREKAGEYSFILSLPAIAGALILELKDLDTLSSLVSVPVVFAGALSAFAVGLVSLLLLLRMVRRGRLFLFSFYLIPLGLFGLVYF